MATKLLYLEDFDVLKAGATVVKVSEAEAGLKAVELDRTCF